MHLLLLRGGAIDRCNQSAHSGGSAAARAAYKRTVNREPLFFLCPPCDAQRVAYPPKHIQRTAELTGLDGHKCRWNDGMEPLLLKLERSDWSRYSISRFDPADRLRYP